MYDSVRHFEQLYTSVPREFAFHASSQEEWLTWRDAFRLSMSNPPLNIYSRFMRLPAYRTTANSISAKADTATIKQVLGPSFASISTR